MIVDLKEITDTPRYYRVTHAPGWWKGTDPNDPVLDLSVPLNANIELKKANNGKYLMKGSIKGKVYMRCDRCLEHFHRDVDEAFNIAIVIQSLNREEEMEIFKTDLSADFRTEERIDLDEVIREQIYLSLPIKSICKTQCLGLCPSCGTNLNVAACNCQSQGGSPGFSKLSIPK